MPYTPERDTDFLSEWIYSYVDGKFFERKNILISLAEAPASAEGNQSAKDRSSRYRWLTMILSMPVTCKGCLVHSGNGEDAVWKVI